MQDKSIRSFVEKIIKKRNDKIISAYKKGESIRMIEACFGITKTRIYQILHKAGVDICRNNNRVIHSVKTRELDKKKKV